VFTQDPGFHREEPSAAMPQASDGGEANDSSFV
jgi:hypothetical protein